MSNKYLFLCLCLVLTIGSGCQSPGKSVADHFSRLNEIAEDSPSDCPSVSKSLNEYLDLHEASLKAAVGAFIKATPQEAESIKDYSSKLHLVISRCKDPEMDRFEKRLSEIIL